MRALNDTPIVTIGELAGDVAIFHEHAGQPLGVATGRPGVDEHWRCERGTLTVVTGIPGAGKSEVMDQIIVHTAMRDKWRWLVLSPENLPLQAHAAKIVEKSMGLPFGRQHGYRMSREQAYEECQRIGGMVRLIEPSDEDAVDLEWIMLQMERAWSAEEYEALLIDPWSEMEWQRPPNMTETEYTGKVLTLLRRWARARKIALFIVAHPMKLRKDDTGNYPVPTPYDISGSSHWRNKPDVCITMWRQYMIAGGVADKSGQVDLYVMKMRNRLSGQLGKVPLWWSSITGRYYASEATRLNDEMRARKEIQTYQLEEVI